MRTQRRRIQQLTIRNKRTLHPPSIFDPNPKREHPPQEIAIIIIAAVLALGAAACGDDSGGLGAFGGSDFCGDNDNINSSLDSVSDSSPEDFQESITNAYSLMQQAAASAPGEIQDDVQYLVDGYGQIIDAYEAADWNFLAADISGIEFDEVRADQAVANIDAYCGVDDSGDGGDDGGSGGFGDDGSTPDLGDIDLDGVDPDVFEPDLDAFDDVDLDNPASILGAIYGWDDQLAQCVVDELGITDASDQVDFSDPNMQICGQSLIELFVGG